MSLWPAEFISPMLQPDHCRDILVEGAYDLPIEGQFRILDIGANVGAAARFFKARWPDCEIDCYEPIPTNFALLLKTIEGMENVRPHACGVLDFNGTKGISLDQEELNSCGEYSFARANPTLEVPILDAKELPDADILKVDAEGSEMAIFKSLFFAGKIRYRAVIFEYHNFNVGIFIAGILTFCGYRMIAMDSLPSDDAAIEVGVMKFIKNDAAEQPVPHDDSRSWGAIDL